jgi:hypothetical protein
MPTCLVVEASLVYRHPGLTSVTRFWPGSVPDVHRVDLAEAL